MSKANKRAARGVGDTEGIRAEDMGSPVRAVVGEHGKVTVRALASAYEKIGKGEEPPEDDDHHGGGAAAGGEVEADLNLEDEELQLDDDNLDLDEEPAAAPAADDDEELELDDEDLDLGEDEEAAVSATHNTGANQMMTAGDLGDDEELELDDEDLDLGDEEPAPAAEVTKPQPPQQQQQAAAAPAASKPAAAPASQKPVVSGPTTIANDGTAIFTVQSHLLPNNKYLREPFRVVKVDEGALLGTSKKERIWDVDFFAKKFSNLDLAGYKSFSQPASNLFRVEKHMTDPRRLILYFFDAPHPYDLILTSPERRNRFFELAMVQRRNSILWCPSLCPEGINDAVVHVIGTSIQRPSGKVARVTGDGKFAVARMPYEIIDFWFGCLSLQQKPLPASNAILANFIPKADHDVYVIGVADIPGSLVGKPEIGSFFNTYLGSAYHLLSQTILESKDEPGKTCNGIIVLVRRSFILRTSNIDAVEIDNMKDGQKKGDFTVVAAQLRINESSLCCIMVNGSPTASPEPNVRSAGIRALLASINMGNETLDIGLRHDYIFVAGCYGFEENWGANDGLIKQQTAGNLLQEFKEATPDALLKAKSGADPFRVLYNVRAGTCRADIKRYYAGQGLHLNNAAVSVDLFTLRPFLSTFAEYAPNVVIKLSSLNIINQRMPNYTAGELLFSGEWLDAAPVSIHMQKDIDGYKIPDSVIPALRPVCNHHDFVRLQHMQFSIMGFLPNMKSAKGKPKKIIIASGSLPFKTGIEKGATKEFATPLIYRGCIVGSLVGSITYKESNEAV